MHKKNITSNKLNKTEPANFDIILPDNNLIQKILKQLN